MARESRGTFQFEGRNIMSVRVMKLRDWALALGHALRHQNSVGAVEPLLPRRIPTSLEHCHLSYFSSLYMTIMIFCFYLI